MRSLKKVKFIQDRCVYKIDARLRSGGWEALRQTLHTPTTIVVCKLFQYAWDYLKFNVWERDKKGVPYIALSKYGISDNCHLI